MRTLEHERATPSLSGGVGWQTGRHLWLRMGIGWGLAMALAAAGAVLVFAVLLRPPRQHVVDLVGYLVVGGLICALAGAGALWLATAARVGIRLKLAIPSLLAALVVGFTVVVIARLMFYTAADEIMLLAFLIFAVAIALVVSFSIANVIARAIQRIETGARRIAEGEYSFRLAGTEAQGGSELDRLATWFNHMAASVQLAFARQQASEAQRREMVAALSHDVRTPLSSIRAMIEAIDDGIVTDPEVIRRYQRTMRAEMLHLGVLLDGLFEVSRIEAGALQLDRESTNLGDLLSDVLEATSEQAKRQGIHLAGHVEGDLPMVWADVRQIQRVLANLLQNALRYTPAGGAILLYASALSDERGAEQVAVRVVDTGQGIAASDLPHIFEMAYRGESSRTRPQQLGEIAASAEAGLGLAIARGLVEAHHGTIRAESPLPSGVLALLTHEFGEQQRVGLGTVVSFTLPTAHGFHEGTAERGLLEAGQRIPHQS